MLPRHAEEILASVPPPGMSFETDSPRPIGERRGGRVGCVLRRIGGAFIKNQSEPVRLLRPLSGSESDKTDLEKS